MASLPGRENPDLLASPHTDAGTIPNLKFSFAAARNRLLTGGWAREVTVRELPVAIELAGQRSVSRSPGPLRSRLTSWLEDGSPLKIRIEPQPFADRWRPQLGKSFEFKGSGRDRLGLCLGSGR